MIEFKNVTKKFGDFTAVDHLNMTIETGEFFGFLGPNGAGKTTLLKTLVVELCDERSQEPPKTEDPNALWATFRALVNTRPPIPADPAWLAMQALLFKAMVIKLLHITLSWSECKS